MRIKTKEDRRDRIKHRIRKRVRGHGGASAADRVPQRRAHLRAGGGRRQRPDDCLGVDGGAGGEGRAGQEREGRQRRPAPRRSARPSPSGCSRRASSAWCSTATGSSITGASRQWPTRRAKQVWSSNVALMNRDREKVDASQLEIKDTVVSINRVTKVVKGGKNLSFSALVVVGDGARRRRLRRRQGEGSAVGHQEGHRGGEEEPDPGAAERHDDSASGGRPVRLGQRAAEAGAGRHRTDRRRRRARGRRVAAASRTC